MNIQTIRINLADLCEQLLPSEWMVTTRTWPDLNATYTAQIGHPRTIAPETLAGRRVDLPVLLWILEDHDASAVDAMYAAISFDEGSFVSLLEASKPLVMSIDVESVGLRLDERPANYVAAELTVACRSSAT